MTAQDALDQLKSRFPEAVLHSLEFRDELTLVTSLDQVKGLLQACRDDLGFDYLIDVSSLDHFGQDPRFEMVYEIYSYEHGAHLRVRVAVAEDRDVPTVSDIWPTANWHEREVYDMMGIKFEGHPDLRRILMWEGYPYFPLRKEFPLAGKPSEMPDVAFTGVAPLAGGPFVTSPSDGSAVAREPRAKKFSDQ